MAIVEIAIDEKGRVFSPKLMTSSGIDEFDRDALALVQKWRFETPTCDGKPASVHIAVEMRSTIRH